MPAPGRRGPAVAVGAALLTAVAYASAPGVAQAAEPTGPPAEAVTEQTISGPGRAEPAGTPVALDSTLLTPPSTGPHPAVLLAHGFGGSKSDLVDRARDLAGRGYVVLTYSARGFGASAGRIHLDDADYEVADARALVDRLAARPEVRLDRSGD